MFDFPKICVKFCDGWKRAEENAGEQCESVLIFCIMGCSSAYPLSIVPHWVSLGHTTCEASLSLTNISCYCVCIAKT